MNSNTDTEWPAEIDSRYLEILEFVCKQVLEPEECINLGSLAETRCTESGAGFDCHLADRSVGIWFVEV